MKKLLVTGVVGALALATGAEAQSCSNSWGFVADGGFEGDTPEAFSPCQDGGRVAVLCVGPALMVTYTPPEGDITSDPNGNAHWPIKMTIGDFEYADHVYYMGATGEFAFVRVAWDSVHPLFKAMQAGSGIEVSMPAFNTGSFISLSGSRGAISQVIDSCQY